MTAPRLRPWSRAAVAIACAAAVLLCGACRRAPDASPSAGQVASAAMPARASARAGTPPPRPAPWQPLPAEDPPGHEPASDDTEASLMRSAFPDWQDDVPFTRVLHLPDADVRVALSPAVVLFVDADTRILVLRAVVSDEQGRPDGGHAQGGYVAAVRFDAQEGRWRPARYWPAVDATGFMGDPGSVTAVPLGEAHAAAAVENGSCWQGYCMRLLQLYAASRAGLQAVLLLRLDSSSTGATDDCDKPRDQRDAGVPGPDAECFDVRGDWHVDREGQGGWRDVVVDYDVVERPEGSASAPAAVHAERVTLRARYQDGHYRVVAGRDPNHEL